MSTAGRTAAQSEQAPASGGGHSERKVADLLIQRSIALEHKLVYSYNFFQWPVDSPPETTMHAAHIMDFPPPTLQQRITAPRCTDTPPLTALLCYGFSTQTNACNNLERAARHSSRTHMSMSLDGAASNSSAASSEMLGKLPRSPPSC